MVKRGVANGFFLAGGTANNLGRNTWSPTCILSSQTFNIIFNVKGLFYLAPFRIFLVKRIKISKGSGYI